MHAGLPLGRTATAGARYQPDDSKRSCVDLRGRRNEKPRHEGGVLSESRGRLVRFAPARESESGDANAEKRQGCRLGNSRYTLQSDGIGRRATC